MQCEALAYHLGDLQTRREDYGLFARTTLMRGALLTGSDYVQAQRFRTYWRKEVARSMVDLDVLITPTAPVPAGLIEDMTPDSIVLGPIFTFPFNVTGQPAITVPCGFSSDTHMPLAMQIAGKPFSETTVLRTAHAYQQATDWHLEVPPVGVEVAA
jgi:aspartyl-tRNA(Asn)/glutamyl-tRNA(Gln) amidotransferase subunit A